MDTIRKGYVEANGVRYGYEVHGSGAPLLLLHGGFGTMDMFRSVLDRMTARHQVIMVDLYGHGRTALTDRPIDAVTMGDDMAIIVQRLGFERVDVLGFSAGAKVAMRFAIQHPDAVGRLVVASIAFASTGFFPALVEQQKGLSRDSAAMLMQTPMYAAYRAVAPRVEDFPEFVARMGEGINRPYDWSEEVKTLKPDTLLIFGDSDMFPLEHIIRFYQLLGGGQRDGGWDRSGMCRHRLAILPGMTHYEMSDAPAMIDTALAFLSPAAPA